MSASSSPIADLSYRNYEGPLAPTNMRWWVIAKTTFRTGLKRKGVWFWTAAASFYYLFMIMILYFLDQMAQAAPPNQPNPMTQFLSRIVWKDQFVHAFSYGQVFFLIIALLIGAGTIANDNRSNALLVYLSKPCTKGDYILGKWSGVFLFMLMVMSIPALMFFAYGALSYRDVGFLYEDRWLLPKVIAMVVCGAAIHSSLVIGFSSLFNQGRLAGATYSGVYFVSTFFTGLMYVLFLASDEDRGTQAGAEAAYRIAGNLSYLSIDGLNIAMARSVIGFSGSSPFGGGQPMTPTPSLLTVMLIVVAVCATCLLVAWRRIRAVEVVG